MFDAGFHTIVGDRPGLGLDIHLGPRGVQRFSCPRGTQDRELQRELDDLTRARVSQHLHKCRESLIRQRGMMDL
jgi:hypothetical protein